MALGANMIFGLYGAQLTFDSKINIVMAFAISYSIFLPFHANAPKHRTHYYNIARVPCRQTRERERERDGMRHDSPMAKLFTFKIFLHEIVQFRSVGRTVLRAHSHKHTYTDICASRNQLIFNFFILRHPSTHSCSISEQWISSLFFRYKYHLVISRSTRDYFLFYLFSCMFSFTFLHHSHWW